MIMFRMHSEEEKGPPESNLPVIIALCVFLAGIVLLVLGSANLTRAKGYGEDSGDKMILFISFFALCCSPIALFAVPFVIIFGLKDKAKGHRSKRHW